MFSDETDFTVLLKLGIMVFQGSEEKPFLRQCLSGAATVEKMIRRGYRDYGMANTGTRD